MTSSKTTDPGAHPAESMSFGGGKCNRGLGTDSIAPVDLLHLLSSPERTDSFEPPITPSWPGPGEDATMSPTITVRFALGIHLELGIGDRVG